MRANLQRTSGTWPVDAAQRNGGCTVSTSVLSEDSFEGTPCESRLRIVIRMSRAGVAGLREGEERDLPPQEPRE